MEATFKYRSRIIIKGITPFLNKKSKVLDIGCGNGVVSQEIEKHFGCSIKGTDVWEYLIRNIEFKKMPSRDKLDFKNGEFDVGLFNDVLHHISSERQIILVKEALRVCKQVLIFEVKPTFIAMLVEYPLNWLNNINVANPLSHRDKEGWMQLFKENHIYCEFYHIERPSFWYPFVNYLFCLENK